MDPRIVDKINKVVSVISNVLKNPSEGCIVISGCGTSGRLAYLTSRRFNNFLKSQDKEECLKYIISGGNDALYSSVELAEDDPSEGARRLKEVVEGKTRVVFIGVTCGLSAPYVAGQLEMCLSDLETFTPVLLGFNAAHQARKIPMKHLNKTFHEVVLNMLKEEQEEKAFILNPIVGPEPIAGSSRMKSGTTTKIVLEMLALLGTANLNSSSTNFNVSCLVDMYKDICQAVYAQAESLGSLMHITGESLRGQGHLYYLGCDGVGLMGIIDASECRPTFGASFHDIRGFVDGGIDGLDCQPISSVLSIDDFKKEILPNLEANDTVIVFGADMAQKVDPSLFSSPCKRAFVNFITDEEVSSSSKDQASPSRFGVNITIDLRPTLNRIWSLENTQMDETGETTSGPGTQSSLNKLLAQLAQEAAMKWVVNCTSTGTYIQLGKVFKNLMVDVRVSNAKLFYRACGIVQDICNIEEADSKACLLKSIYGIDNLSDTHTSGPVIDHVLAASGVDRVVPTAILIGLRRCSVQQARTLLDAEPNLSKVLKDLQSQALPL